MQEVPTFPNRARQQVARGVLAGGRMMPGEHPSLAARPFPATRLELPDAIHPQARVEHKKLYEEVILGLKEIGALG